MYPRQSKKEHTFSKNSINKYSNTYTIFKSLIIYIISCLILFIIIITHSNFGISS